tara:strand:- start:91 stop:1488 length:1398 start_codon:yes stop_codon:yes gene_type:complete
MSLLKKNVVISKNVEKNNQPQQKTGSSQWIAKTTNTKGVRNTSQTSVSRRHRFAATESRWQLYKNKREKKRREKKQKDNIDKSMRTAYTEWSKKCIDNDIATTPAYDVVGLLSVFHPEKFDVSGEVLKLKQEFRKPSGLLALDYPTESDINLIIITDFGEECDDEVTVALAPKTAQLVFTDKTNFDKQVSVYKKFGGDSSRVHAVEDLWSLLKADKHNVILQIGPIHSKDYGDLVVPTVAVYDYHLVGVIGTTLNSKGDAKRNAEVLKAGASKKSIVDTDGGKGAFPFSYSHLKKALAGRISSKGLTALSEHVIKIGWRNTVGRASPKFGMYISHLVVKDVGANHATVSGVLNNCLTASEATEMTLLSVRDGTVQKAELLAEHYFEKMLEGSLTLDTDGNSTNSIRHVTKSGIIEGYTFILVTLNKLFGVPLEFFESGGGGNWKPEWNTPGPVSGPVKHPFIKRI